LKRLLKDYEAGNHLLTETRRTWLQRLDASGIFAKVLQFWTRNAYRLVPEPENTSLNYEDCAEWLAVVRDLDPPSCEKILQGWKLRHRRRKNLWKALESAKIRLV
jgi:hypothetical protein